MAEFHLYIFDYNYSSWSMRTSVLLRAMGAPFSETRLNLNDAGRAEARKLSPSGQLPLLVHGDLHIWDSLAIAEYLAEQFPDRHLWPQDPVARALARAASAEMHSGFSAMRSRMAMNIRAHYPHYPRAADVERDVERIQQLWGDLRTRFGRGGEFLCGAFGIVDAMFAPVVMRFRTYDVKLHGVCLEYATAVLHHPAVQGWLDDARRDSFHNPAYDRFVD